MSPFTYSDSHWWHIHLAEQQEQGFRHGYFVQALPIKMIVSGSPWISEVD